MLEEALQLLAVAVGGGQELGRVDRLRLEPADVLELGDQLAAEALDPAAGPRPGRRARSRRRSGRRRGRRAPAASRCGRAARATGRRSRCAPSGDPCARTRSGRASARPGRQLGDRGDSPALPGCRLAAASMSPILPGARTDASLRVRRRPVHRLRSYRWIRSAGKATRPSFARRSSSARSAAGTTPPRAASTALATVADSLDAELIAELDPEEFFDFQANRPTITLERRADPPHRVAAEQPAARRPRPGRRARPRPARRHRAEPALAHLLGDDRDRRRRARGRDGGHPRAR